MGICQFAVIHDGNVVVLCDVANQFLSRRVRPADGKELWRTPRKDVPTWGTPTVAKHVEQTQILVNGWHHSGAYDFANGKEIWRLDGGGDIPVPTPVVANGLAYLTSAHGRSHPMRAIRLEANGDITPSDIGATNASIAWPTLDKGITCKRPSSSAIIFTVVRITEC